MPECFSVTLEWYFGGCNGPDGCGSEEPSPLWKGNCGCWVFKCVVCGSIGFAVCPQGVDSECANEFDYLAATMV